MFAPGPLQPDLVTPRLRLRPLRAADAALIGLYAGDLRLARMTASIPHPYPPGLAEAFVERVRAPGSPETAWALDTGADGENGLVGIITMKRRPGSDAEIGYWVAPAFWGTGLAGEAVAAVAERARSLGLPALTAQAFQDNAASIRVLTRAGFDFLGETRCTASRVRRRFRPSVPPRPRR